jgi:molecular chaperone GrpE (heat shock protein)
VARKGYRIGERLLRPSNIIVAHNDEAGDAASNDQ